MITCPVLRLFLGLVLDEGMMRLGGRPDIRRALARRALRRTFRRYQYALDRKL